MDLQSKKPVVRHGYLHSQASAARLRLTLQQPVRSGAAQALTSPHGVTLDGLEARLRVHRLPSHIVLSVTVPGWTL